MKPAILCPSLAIIFFAVCLPSHAQVAIVEKEGVVSGTGQVVLERLPDTLRLQVAVLSKASTLKDALEGLNDRIEAAKVQLATLGVDKDSIGVGGPKIASLKSPQQQQVERMMREQSMRNGRKQPDTPAKTPVVVSADLTAVWKLSAKTAEELLLASYPLQEKVKAADLAGAAEAAKVSAEEQEMLDEAESEMGGYSQDGESKPGDPLFLFVTRFSDEEIEKALAEGFQKAKADAERVCKAAGIKLGPLTTVRHSNAPDIDYSVDPTYYSGHFGQVFRQMQMSQQNAANLSEAVGLQPENVKLTVTVNTSFGLLPE